MMRHTLCTLWSFPTSSSRVKPVSMVVSTDTRLLSVVSMMRSTSSSSALMRSLAAFDAPPIAIRACCFVLLRMNFFDVMSRIGFARRIKCSSLISRMARLSCAQEASRGAKSVRPTGSAALTFAVTARTYNADVHVPKCVSKSQAF